jgi:hypothetical protein
MAEIVNLRHVRKAKVRAAAEQEADANRRKFGRTKAEKERAAVENRQTAKILDDSLLDPHKK